MDGLSDKKWYILFSSFAFFVTFLVLWLINFPSPADTSDTSQS